MAATAPYLNECVKCKDVFENYTPDIIKRFEDNFGDVEDCQAFLANYRKNPNSNFNQCEYCLRSKWRRMQSKKRSIRNAEIGGRSKKSHNGNSRMYLMLLVVFVSFLFGFVCRVDFFKSSNDNANDVSEAKLTITFKRLKDQFPSLHVSLLKKISGAFKRLKTPGEPFVFLLLHDDTNKKTTDCLASYTSIVAKQNIFTNTTKSLWMNGSEWTHYSDHDNQNLIYEKLITPLKENKVLVLENLQDLPWSLAKSLHHLCDVENPQIAKAMYILELRVNGDGQLQQLTDGDKLVAAERAMTKAWQDAPNAFRQALIARLTSYVDAVLLKSDNECLSESSDQSFIWVLP